MKHYGLTPELYRLRWDLAADYPMVSANYVEQKRALALKGGFGKTVRPPSRGGKPAVVADCGATEAPASDLAPNPNRKPLKPLRPALKTQPETGVAKGHELQLTD